MNKLFQYLPLFVEVARQKSLTKAADVLDMPLSTVSRRIIALEKELGVQLFHRSARKIELTDGGHTLFERCETIVAEADNAFEDASDAQASPKGEVRISMPPEIYYEYLMGAFAAFSRKWPDIHLHIHINSRWVDLYSEPYDIDLRAGPLPDSDLKTRRLTWLDPMLLSSPEFLQKYPVPQCPADVEKIPAIVLEQHKHKHWGLSNGDQTAFITPRAIHTVNSPGLALEFVLQGLGISWFSMPMVKDYVESGALVRLLPDWKPKERIEVNMVIASNNISRRVRLLVEHLSKHFSEVKNAVACPQKAILPRKL
ncbi:LysR family transcriptional regulator [Desulfovibrio sp. OttesenSCG-928-G15]|nr:LysR family transcriptional regulator [Desulfovibrio sp. OttesenSCG-928-G15]